MKKLKTFLFFLGAGLLLASALALTSCKPENENNNGNENGTTPSGGGEITNPVNIDYNAPEEFEVTLTVSVAGGDADAGQTNHYLKCKKGVQFNDAVSYFINDESVAAFKQDNETNEWELSTILPGKSNIDYLNTLCEGFFGVYEDYERGLASAGSAVLLGRNCTKYTYSLLSYYFSYYIDNEYGICLKYEEKINNTVWQQWEITEFKTTGISLPEIDYKTQISNAFGKYIGTWTENKTGDIITITDDYKLSIAGSEIPLTYANNIVYALDNDIPKFYYLSYDADSNILTISYEASDLEHHYTKSK